MRTTLAAAVQRSERGEAESALARQRLSALRVAWPSGVDGRGEALDRQFLQLHTRSSTESERMPEQVAVAQERATATERRAR
ncbi:hypothetical protein OR16_04167 [Cupriavidus basilensis OR16]|uniref:Uncharacterized protein n=1 Tax=Cupriavidus basilensis OR16 TaxID=1127483 RepID=H1RZS7_9BURK|nr:hypothetical protein OR16_04167 [Cupriavidus basilensis OR16]